MSWHEVHFWSFNLSLHEKSHKWLITLVCWYLVSYEYMCPCTSKNIGQISYILCQLLLCSGKSQLSNYANANYLKISIWTLLMSYHVKTTLCHDIMTYDISWQPYNKINMLWGTSGQFDSYQVLHCLIQGHQLTFVYMCMYIISTQTIAPYPCHPHHGLGMRLLMLVLWLHLSRVVMFPRMTSSRRLMHFSCAPTSLSITIGRTPSNHNLRRTENTIS